MTTKKTEDPTPETEAFSGAGGKKAKAGDQVTLTTAEYNALGGSGGIPAAYGHACDKAHQNEDGTVTVTLGEKVKG